MSSIINGKTVTIGITLGSTGTYTSPLTITSTGGIKYGGSGYAIRDNSQGTVLNAGYVDATNSSILYAINMAGRSYLQNSGTIKSANGGVDMEGGTFVNSGSLLCPATATRYGVLLPGYITSGVTHFSYLHNLATGYLSEGVAMDGLLVNAGTLTDANGNGISSVQTHNYQLTVINSGTISGSGPGPTYGFGVILRAGGTVTNSGTIIGANGTAVAFQGSIANRVVLDPGYKLSGKVTGSTPAGATNTLELAAGASAGTASGLGSEFVNFGSVLVDSGATWTLGGSNTIGSGVTVTNSGSLTITASQTISGGAIALNSGTLSDTAGIVVSSGALSGFGTVSAGTSLSGSPSGTVKASGGTLDLLGPVSNGPGLAIDTTAGSDLKIDGTATAASAISISNANQTLEIGAAGNLTVAAAESITLGQIKLDGGTLTDSSGVTISSGSLFGSGQVSGSIGGAGLIEAIGGTLDLTGAVQSTATGLLIANGSNTLELDGSVAAGATIGFGGAAGTLRLTDFSGQTLTGFSGKIAGMNVGASATVPTDAIDLTAVTFANVTSATVSGSSIIVDEGAATVATISLAAAPPANTFVDWVADSGSGTDIFLSAVACFCRGAHILTETSEVAVEDLRIGDRVVTLSGEARPIRWIGRRAYDGRFIAGNRGVLPICISANALREGMPSRDLWLSPEHSLYLDGVLVQAKHLVNGATITQAERVDTVEYFHVELDDHDVIFADNAAAETYVDCDNRLMFENAGEYALLYPADDRPRWEFCLPRLDWEDEELSEIRAALLWRAGALGHTVERDPDPYLIVDGAAIRPDSVASLVYRFIIPAGSGAVSLASRSSVPAETVAQSRDVRRLGVPVERIVLYDEDLLIEIGHGHAGLANGFHADEDGHRWTDGLARLPDSLLRPFAGAFTLELRLVSCDLAYQIPPPLDTATTA